jgi:hypothetical protein
MVTCSSNLTSLASDPSCSSAVGKYVKIGCKQSYRTVSMRLLKQSQFTIGPQVVEYNDLLYSIATLNYGKDKQKNHSLQCVCHHFSGHWTMFVIYA